MNMKMKRNFAFLFAMALVLSVLGIGTTSAGIIVEPKDCYDILSMDCIMYGDFWEDPFDNLGSQTVGSDKSGEVCSSGVACSSTSSNCRAVCNGLSSGQQENFTDVAREVGGISESLSSDQMRSLATAKELRFEDTSEGKTLTGTRCVSGPSIGECSQNESFSFDISGSHISDSEAKEILRRTGFEELIGRSNNEIALSNGDLEVSCGSSQFSIEKTGSDSENRESSGSETTGNSQGVAPENSREKGFLSGLFTANN